MAGTLSEIPCWIRGNLSRGDLKGNPVRQATQDCPYRIARRKGLFSSDDYKCTHPAALREHESTKVEGGALIVGSIDGYATFCEPVDMHLTSLGEPSRYIPEAAWQEVEVVQMLSPGDTKTDLGR